MRTAQFTPTKFPDRARPWCVSIPAAYSPSGRRERKFFDTQRDANNFAKAERIRIDREGRTSGAVLSAIQREAAAAAFRLIPNEAPAKLIEIVEQWKTRRELATKSETLSAVFAQYIARGKKKRGRGGMVQFVPFSKKHKRGIEYAEKQLAAHKESKVCDITQKMITDALVGCSSSYFNAHLRIIRAVFEFAVDKKWATENPAEGIDPKTASKESAATAGAGAHVLTVKQAQSLMTVAAEVAPDYVPFMALALFAGIRPDLEDGELVKMTWDMIRLKDRNIEIPAAISKTRERRIIEMEDTLVEWLKYYTAKNKDPEGPIVPTSNLRERMRLLRSVAGVEWKQDITRHSFATYHLTHFENLARCVTSMGHRDSQMLWAHYHAAAARDVAAAYWKITPAALRL
jgi:integrase